MIDSKNMEFSQGEHQGCAYVQVGLFNFSLFHMQCFLSSLISQSSNFVMAGVKNLMVNKYNLPFTKIVDDIMEQNQGNYGRQIPRSFCQKQLCMVYDCGGFT